VTPGKPLAITGEQALWFRARRGGLAVEIRPLGGWRRALLPGVRREVRSVAAHLGLSGAKVEIAG
jgi:hypothetical protein